MKVTQHLAQEVTTAKFEDIPQSVVTRVKHGILDDVGIAFLGYSAVGEPLVNYAKDIGGGRPESVIIGDGSKVSCIAAAGVNAQMAYDTDFNEAGPGHHVLSALAQTALAIGQRVGATGKDIITAVAIGYEMSGRFHNALGPEQTSRGEGKRHNSLVVSMTAAKLLRLDDSQLNHALGIAWYFQPQPSDFNWRNVWWKRIGNPLIGFCHLGIQAALLAQKGFEGPTNIIDKESFYDCERLIVSPSPYYYPGNEMDLKPWISSRAIHPGIQAALEIVYENNINPNDIEKVTFRGSKLYLNYPFNCPQPTEHWDAVYSVQWTFAMALLGYEPGPEWLSHERLSDPMCRSLSSKVSIEQDPVGGAESSTSKLLADGYSNEVEIVARGKHHTKRKTSKETLGSSGIPMSEEHLVRKFNAQTVPVIGQRKSEQLVQALLHLEEQDDIVHITEMLS
jgi:2-methylcitrate dehydratase PrpD